MTNLPQLTGSTKQVNWATDIRDGYLAEQAEIVAYADKALAGNPDAKKDYDRLMEAVDFVMSKTSAAWWIEYKDHGLRYCAQLVASGDTLDI